MEIWGTAAIGKKREVIDAYLLLCQSKEALDTLREEASNIWVFYEKQMNVSSQQLKALSNKTDPFNRGTISLFGL